MKTPIQALAHRPPFHRFHKDSRGVTTVEYVIVLVIIGIVAIGFWKQFGTQLQGQIKASGDAVEKLN